MYYCKACRRLEEINRCGVCGARNLPFPGAGDFCFVEKQPLIWAGMLEDVLRIAEKDLEDQKRAELLTVKNLRKKGNKGG